MIPKIIHWIWFGKGEIPELEKKCIESWKRIMPDFQFMLWNEENFDVSIVGFTREAYEHKKWAFVADYVRLYVLYKYGGWYLDTDVEAIRSLTPLLNNSLVMSTDSAGYIESAIIGAEAKHIYLKEALDYYNKLSFVEDSGRLNVEVINTYLQLLLKKYGYIQKNKLQFLDAGIVLFTDDYFNALSLATGKYNITSNTYTIHRHSLSWVSKKTKFIYFIRLKILAPILGPSLLNKLRKICKRK